MLLAFLLSFLPLPSLASLLFFSFSLAGSFSFLSFFSFVGSLSFFSFFSLVGSFSFFSFFSFVTSLSFLSLVPSTFFFSAVSGAILSLITDH